MPFLSWLLQMMFEQLMQQRKHVKYPSLAELLQHKTSDTPPSGRHYESTQPEIRESRIWGVCVSFLDWILKAGSTTLTVVANELIARYSGRGQGLQSIDYEPSRNVFRKADCSSASRKMTPRRKSGRLVGVGGNIPRFWMILRYVWWFRKLGAWVPAEKKKLARRVMRVQLLTPAVIKLHYLSSLATFRDWFFIVI